MGTIQWSVTRAVSATALMGIDEGTGGREGGTVSEGVWFFGFFAGGDARARGASSEATTRVSSVGSHAQADELGDEPTDEQVEYADRAAPGDARDLGGSGLVVVVARAVQERRRGGLGERGGLVCRHGGVCRGGGERTRTRGIGAREREARGERRRRGQESRTSRGAGWESSAKGES